MRQILDLHSFIMTYFYGMIFTKEKVIILVTFFRGCHVQQVIEGVGVNSLLMFHISTPNTTSCF
jgi:hypothetical protein